LYKKEEFNKHLDLLHDLAMRVRIKTLVKQRMTMLYSGIFEEIGLYYEQTFKEKLLAGTDSLGRLAGNLGVRLADYAKKGSLVSLCDCEMLGHKLDEYIVNSNFEL